jgi:hypothetical protein
MNVLTHGSLAGGGLQVLETPSAAGTPPSVYINEVDPTLTDRRATMSYNSHPSLALKVRDILSRERPDIIWSQSGWSADGLLSLGIPIICSIHDGYEGLDSWVHNKRWGGVDADGDSNTGVPNSSILAIAQTSTCFTTASSQRASETGG